MKSLGIRHIALNVKDPQASKAFYKSVFQMEVEWEPDPENIYLTSGGQDNLALHKATGPVQKSSALDHFGFVLPTPESVDSEFSRIKGLGVKIAKDLKTHRDGARSFYIEDPDGILIQLIYHPPISGR